MKLAFEVTCGVGVAGELGAEVHGCAATLSVEAAHGEIVGVGIDVWLDGEIPTPPHTRHLDIEPPWFAKSGKICGLNLIPRIGIMHCGAQLSLENNRVVARPLERESLSRSRPI